MKGSTQPMKKLLVLLPLLLVGCTNDSGFLTNTKTSSNKIIYNVQVDFIYDKHCYKIWYYENDKQLEKEIPPKNYYYVEIKEYQYVPNKNEIISNEYFVSSNELFVYHKK